MRAGVGRGGGEQLIADTTVLLIVFSQQLVYQTAVSVLARVSQRLR